MDVLATVRPLSIAVLLLLGISAAWGQTPQITNPPQTQFLAHGQTAAFSVTASGAEPLSYQWRKEQVTLANDARISGSTSATLTIGNVTAGDIGRYNVVVTNIQGTVSSRSARLGLMGFASAAGGDPYGQLGVLGSLPAGAALIGDAVKIAAGTSHCVAVKTDGTVWAWGRNDYGQLGEGTTTTRQMPVQVVGLTGVIGAAAGSQHCLAVKANGTVWAWGSNNFGQMGDGTTTQRNTAVQVPGLAGVVAVAAGAGASHSLALKADGTIWAWGYNSNGQLGDTSTTNRWNPVQVSGVTGVTAVAAGTGHSLALKSDGTVWAWGQNTYGQLGDSTNAQRTAAVQVVDLTTITTIAAGSQRSLVCRSDGTVWSWGYNNCGQLGDGTTTNRSAPVQVVGLSDVTTVAGGASHSLAMKMDGTVWAWGYNNYAQLGDDTTTDRHTPVQVQGVPATAVAIAGGEFHSLALTADGTAWAWGHNGSGQLGDATARSNRSAATQIKSPTNVVTMASGESHTLAVVADGTVWAWGLNNYGQLGDATNMQRILPVQVVNLTDVVAVAAGDYHSAALASDGTVWTWGRNSQGQLGDGTTTDRLAPVSVANLSNIVAVACGYQHCLALKSDGTVWTWGLNGNGRLGDGTTTTRLTPVQVAGLTGAVAIAGGAAHSLAIKSNGTLWAWGYNNYGQLGLGTSDFSAHAFASEALNVTGAVALAAGGSHSLAIKAGGSVWAWGFNGSGQLGNGSADYSSHPIASQVAGVAAAIMVAGGKGHSLAVQANGTAWGWGRNTSGQLGIGTMIDRYSPIIITGVTTAFAGACGADHSLFLSQTVLPTALLCVSGTWPASARSEVQVKRIVVAFDRPVTNISTDDLTLSAGSVVAVYGRDNGGYVFEVASLPSGSITATLGGDIATGDGVALAPYQWAFTNTAATPPVAQSITAAGYAAVPVTLSLPASDDGQPNPPGTLRYTITRLPAHGTLSDPSGQAMVAAPYILLNRGNRVAYTAADGYEGSDSFDFTADDSGAAPDGGDSNVATVTVSVTKLLYLADMSSNPSWALGLGWSYGTPPAGTNDPVQAYTGTNRIGYNLTSTNNGNYENSLGAARHATTPAISCTGYKNVTLRFYRYLGVESASLDHATIQASNNGEDWTTVWNHTGGTFVDSTWQLMQYDISSVADNKASVYIRWGMGPTDSSDAYCGWNIDDVMVSGEFLPLPPVAQAASVTTRPAAGLTIALHATDDGKPNPPGALTYTITALPANGTLKDASGTPIDTVPYTLPGGGNEVVYTSAAAYEGNDWFDFQASDGGTAPGSGASNVATITIHVSTILYSADMSTNPGWTLGEGWSYGTPAGSHDPAPANTGTARIGYNLTSTNYGDYENDLTAARYAMTPAIDCTGLTNIRLKFYRYLGVEAWSFDKAVIDVSSDQVHWTSVWTNATAINDTSWQLVEYDLTAVAARQPTVYIRWSMGPADRVYTFCGWNIDDVKVTGEPAPVAPTVSPISLSGRAAVPLAVTLHAIDDGLPNPPAALAYVLTSLPAHGNLMDPNGATIDAVPYTLLSQGNQVVYTAATGFEGADTFTFVANDGGQVPDGGDSNIATVTVQVSSVLYSATMSSNPGWTLDEGWAYGTAAGSHDPAVANTGSQRIGYNLTSTNDGDYENSLTSGRYATTPAINCAGYTNIHLRFYRYLGVEAYAYDRASIEVSNDGSTWTPVWVNGSVLIQDTAWQLLDYDLSATTAHRSSVYVRWGVGPTDRVFGHCGWNIDDVTVSGDIGRMPGDIDGNGQVNVADLQILVAAWNSIAGPPPSVTWNGMADLDSDGRVNIGDLQRLVANWGRSL